MLQPSDLEGYMRRHGISGEILHLEIPTPTVEAAARAVGVEEEQIVKTLLFLINQQPVAAIACGTARIDRRAIATRFGVGRKRVKLASADQVLDLSGYPAGALPPFGHRQPFPTLLDRRVLDHTTVYAGGGAENALVRLAPEDIVRFTQAEVVDLLSPPTERP